MRVLILGGNGFIGSHVVDALLAAGHQPRIYDRSNCRYRPRLDGVEYILGRLEDTYLLSEALTDVDVVFHGISTTVPSTSNADPIADVQSNLIGTLNLLSAMADKGIRRIIYLSSGGTVYGNTAVDFINEEHPLKPICSYGVVKVAVENYLFMHQELYGLKPIILRASNPYGERQGRSGVQGVVGTILNTISRDQPIEIWGDGSIVRDFIYVGDLALACLKAIEGNQCGIFNIGSGLGYSIREVIENAQKISKKQINTIYKPPRRFDVSRVVLDISKATSILSWRPSVTLPLGIDRTWKWLNNFS